MVTEIPRPTVYPPPGDPIVIEIPPPEIGIKKVTIPSPGILVITLMPVQSPEQQSEGPALVRFSSSNYSLTSKGASCADVMAWFADGSMYSAKASNSELDTLVGKMNQGHEHDIEFSLQEIVGPTQDNIVANLEAVRVSGTLGVDYGAFGAGQGVGTVSWGYHIDVGRLSQLTGDGLRSTQAAGTGSSCDASPAARPSV